MAIKVPIRTVYDNSNNAIGLSEFQSGDAVGYLNGGTGLTSLGTAGQLLKVNDAQNGYEFASVTALLGSSGTPTGTFGSSSLIPVITVGADGRITDISNTSVASVSGFSWTSGNSTLTISTSAGSNFTAKIDDFDDLNNTGVVAGDYGSSTQIPIVSVRADGRISSISNTAVAGVTNFSYATGNNTFTISTADGGVFDATITDLQEVSDALSNLANTNSYIATQEARIDLVNTNLTSTNTAIRTLVSDRLQVANASVLYVTKSTALSSNNALNNLINDRLQVANAEATFVTKSIALSSNNTLVNLINDRMQVANVTSLVSTEVAGIVDSAPETLNTLNELAAALGDDANFASTTTALIGTKAANTYVNQTFVTKSTAVSSNNALVGLINDRLQVANASNQFAASRQSISTVTSNTSLTTSNHNSITIVDSNDNVTVTIDASGNLTTGDKFIITPVGDGNIIVKLDAGDKILGTNLSLLTIQTLSNEQISEYQNSQINGDASVDTITTGLYTKIEIVYAGGTNFVLTK